MKDRSSVNKKIAFVSSSAWTMYNFRKEVLQNLIDSGYQVLIIAGYDKCADVLIAMGCQFVPATIRNRSLNLFQDIQLFFILKNIYKKHGPDFIFHYVVKPNIYGTIAAGLLGIPCVAVVTGLGHAFNKNGILKVLIKNLYRFALRYANEIWCLNKEDAAYFTQYKIVPPQKVKVLPGEGVNTEYFKKEQVRENDKVPFSFLMCARLLKSKGVLEYADASLILRKKNYVFESYLLGARENHPDAILTAQVLKWRQERSLQYLGFVDDVRSYLASSDCFIYPSYYSEGVPRSLLEACSMQLPVITTNNPGCRELVEDGLNGFLCSMHNQNELAAKMEKILLLDKNRRIEMGQKGREMVEARYSMELVVNKYKQLLQSFWKQ